ncbi:MAG: hypothetical protein JO056_12435 [Alphaproteobacteria bacterium]|nr:hypothetical protein [Alphaproteobacteria bacterium]
MSEHAFFYPWSIFGVLVVTYLAAFQYTIYYLRDNHPETWVTIGSPSFLNNSPLNTWHTLKFFFSARHRVLQDERLSQLVTAIRLLFAVDAVFFLVLLAIFPFVRPN